MATARRIEDKPKGRRQWMPATNSPAKVKEKSHESLSVFSYTNNSLVFLATYDY